MSYSSDLRPPSRGQCRRPEWKNWSILWISPLSRSAEVSGNIDRYRLPCLAVRPSTTAPSSIFALFQAPFSLFLGICFSATGALADTAPARRLLLSGKKSGRSPSSQSAGAEAAEDGKEVDGVAYLSTCFLVAETPGSARTAFLAPSLYPEPQVTLPCSKASPRPPQPLLSPDPPGSLRFNDQQGVWKAPLMLLRKRQLAQSSVHPSLARIFTVESTQVLTEFLPERMSLRWIDPGELMRAIDAAEENPFQNTFVRLDLLMQFLEAVRDLSAMGLQIRHISTEHVYVLSEDMLQRALTADDRKERAREQVKELQQAAQKEQTKAENNVRAASEGPEKEVLRAEFNRLSAERALVDKQCEMLGVIVDRARSPSPQPFDFPPLPQTGRLPPRAFSQHPAKPVLPDDHPPLREDHRQPVDSALHSSLRLVLDVANISLRVRGAGRQGETLKPAQFYSPSDDTHPTTRAFWHGVPPKDTGPGKLCDPWCADLWDDVDPFDVDRGKQLASELPPSVSDDLRLRDVDADLDAQWVGQECFQLALIATHFFSSPISAMKPLFGRADTERAKQLRDIFQQWMKKQDDQATRTLAHFMQHCANIELTCQGAADRCALEWCGTMGQWFKHMPELFEIFHELTRAPAAGQCARRSIHFARGCSMHAQLCTHLFCSLCAHVLVVSDAPPDYDGMLARLRALCTERDTKVTILRRFQPRTLRQPRDSSINPTVESICHLLNRDDRRHLAERLRGKPRGDVDPQQLIARVNELFLSREFILQQTGLQEAHLGIGASDESEEAQEAARERYLLRFMECQQSQLSLDPKADPVLPVCRVAMCTAIARAIGLNLEVHDAGRDRDGHFFSRVAFRCGDDEAPSVDLAVSMQHLYLLQVNMKHSNRLKRAACSLGSPD